MRQEVTEMLLSKVSGEVSPRKWQLDRLGCSWGMAEETSGEEWSRRGTGRTWPAGRDGKSKFKEQQEAKLRNIKEWSWRHIMDHGKDWGFYFKYDGRLLKHVEKRKEIHDEVCVENSLCGYLDCKRSGKSRETSCNSPGKKGWGLRLDDGGPGGQK